MRHSDTKTSGFRLHADLGTVAAQILQLIPRWSKSLHSYNNYNIKRKKREKKKNRWKKKLGPRTLNRGFEAQSWTVSRAVGDFETGAACQANGGTRFDGLPVKIELPRYYGKLTFGGKLGRRDRIHSRILIFFSLFLFFHSLPDPIKKRIPLLTTQQSWSFLPLSFFFCFTRIVYVQYLSTV